MCQKLESVVAYPVWVAVLVSKRLERIWKWKMKNENENENERRWEKRKYSLIKYFSTIFFFFKLHFFFLQFNNVPTNAVASDDIDPACPTAVPTAPDIPPKLAAMELKKLETIKKANEAAYI